MRAGNRASVLQRLAKVRLELTRAVAVPSRHGAITPLGGARPLVSCLEGARLQALSRRWAITVACPAVTGPRRLRAGCPGPPLLVVAACTGTQGEGPKFAPLEDAGDLVHLELRRSGTGRGRAGQGRRWRRRSLRPLTLLPAHLSRNSRSSRRTASRSTFRFTRP